MQVREGQQLGNYRLVSLLGKGAFAEVYLGEHLYLKNYAAIKVLLASLNEKDEQLFLSEAQTLAQLTHPNIIRVRDFAVARGTPFLAMDYAPGGTLRQRHAPGSSLPLDVIVDYVKQIAGALQYAHNHDIIHRDVKPENVLQGPEHIMLSDFGISLYMSPTNLSSSQQWAGTLPYMASEQMQGKAVFASDQYSLAVVAYEWLCGARPFEGNSLSLAYQHAQTPPPSLRAKDPSLPEAIEQVILKALAKNPKDRYASILTFARALERATRTSAPDQSDNLQTDAPRLSVSRRVFLSHASNDEVSRLRADLEMRDVAIANHGQQESQDEEAIRQQIRSSQMVLLIISPDTRSSPLVREHLRIADLYRRPILCLWTAGDTLQELQPAGLERATIIDARGQNYRQALDEVLHSLERERGVVSPVVRVPQEPEFEPRNPYKGLQAFTQNDRADFFGRETLVRQMIGSIQETLLPETTGAPGKRLLAVIGPGGSGKSSVVMAGLLPQLRDGAIEGSENWIYLDPLVPGKQPLSTLAHTLAARFPEKDVQAIRAILDNEGAVGLHQLPLSLVQQDTRVVLFIDQFEELFSADVPEKERQHFIDLLVTAAMEPRGLLLILLTLRADFYDRPLAYPSLGRLIQQQQCTVLPMDMADLRTVIERPAIQPDVRLLFDEDLVGDLLLDLRGQAGALPLLEFTLDQLFSHRRGHRLTRQAYEEMGSVRGALSRHAEATYAVLPSDQHRLLTKAIFARLIQPGSAEQEPVRRRADLAEFTLDDTEQTRVLREVIDAFIAARLLTINQVVQATTLEVSHEALLREWTRLTSWMHEIGKDVRLQQTLTRDVAEWEQRNKPKDRLYRGTQLKESLAWQKHNTNSKSEAAFLRSSRTRRTRGRVSLFMVALVVLALVIPAWQLLQLQLTSLTVTTLKDGETGSLRQIIESAAPGSTIVFSADLKGHIALTHSLDIKKNLTIRGPGMNVVSIGGQRTSTLRELLNVLSEAQITFSGLKFSEPNPNDGNFFRNEGTLTFIQCAISDNTMLGFEDIGGLGAAIYNEGTLSMVNSLVSNNTIDSTGAFGGAIANKNGTVILTDTKIINNTAKATAKATSTPTPTPEPTENATGEVIVIATGGAITSENGELRLTNVELSGNKVISETMALGGGIASRKDTITLTNSTILNNSAMAAEVVVGGGIAAFDSFITLNNSQISNNTITSNTEAGGGGISLSEGSLTLNDSTVADNTVTGGNAHIAGGGIFTSDNTVTLTRSTISNNTLNTDDTGSGGGIVHEKGRLVIIESNITNNTINGKEKLIMGAGIAGMPGAIVTVTKSQVTGNALVSDNEAAGGGIGIHESSLKVTGSTIAENTVTANTARGGGISSTTGEINMTDSTVSGNIVKGNEAIAAGGGIYSIVAITLTNSVVSDNTVTSSFAGGGGAFGGGIAALGTLTLTSSTVSGNTVDNDKGVSNGGGIALAPDPALSGDTLKLTNCTISGNKVTGGKSGNGGGITTEGAQGTIEFCTIYGNTASSEGGGLAIGLNTEKTNIKLKGTLVVNNVAEKGPDVAGKITTDGYNLIQGLSDATVNDPSGKQKTDLSVENVANIGIDSQLSTNDGATPTHALLSNSPLLNVIPAESCSVSVDQRGISRPQQNGCDIGAYEYAP